MFVDRAPIGPTALGPLEPDAVVSNRNEATSIFPPDAHLDPLGVGMLADVGQRFQRDPVEHDPEVG